MMIDAFQPEGVTHLAVDSIFMMPQLGVLAQVNEAAATQVFERDCLIHLGTCIAPVGVASPGDAGVTITGELTETVPFGELCLYPLGVGEKARVTIQPERRLDMGGGARSAGRSGGRRWRGRFGSGHSRSSPRNF